MIVCVYVTIKKKKDLILGFNYIYIYIDKNELYKDK